MELCICDCKTMHYSTEFGWLCNGCNGVFEKWIGFGENPHSDYPYDSEEDRIAYGDWSGDEFEDEGEPYDYTEGDIGQDGEI